MTPPRQPPRPLWRFLGPRHWPIWAAAGVLRLLFLLPRRAQLALGRGLGRLTGRLLGRRRHVAQRNLELAFPELDRQAIEALLQANFADLGMAVFDTALAWWGSARAMEGLAEVEGLEHVEAAARGGRGILFISGHYSALELCGRLFARRVPLALTYRDTGQPLVDEIMRRGRLRDVEGVISKRAVREALKRLRDGGKVWMAIDQAPRAGGANATVAPFFGRPAATTTSPSRIAQATGAAVMMVWPERLPDGRCRIRCLPALENFPSDDWTADAARVNALLEEHVRQVPEQYFWVHRRFKAAGGDDPYRRDP